jgi:hypothetical protein
MNEFDATLERGISRMSDFFLEALPRYDFVPLDFAVFRYGAWEWTAFRKGDDDVTQFVIVAALGAPGSQRCTVELWQGLDDGRRFGRSKLKSRSSAWYEIARVVNGWLDELADTIREPLQPTFLNNAQRTGIALTHDLRSSAKEGPGGR